MEKQNEILFEQNKVILQELKVRNVTEESKFSRTLLEPLTGFPLHTVEEFIELNSVQNNDARTKLVSIPYLRHYIHINTLAKVSDKKISYPSESFSIRTFYPSKSVSFRANPWKKEKFNPNEIEAIRSLYEVSYPHESMPIRGMCKDSYPNESKSIRSQPTNSYPNQSETIRNQPKNSDPNESQLISIRWVSAQ